MDDLKPDEVVVTKLEAAERQLSEAIRLFFEERDPIAIHTLASAAGQIATDLAKTRGLNAPFRDTEFLTGEAKRHWIRAVKSLENFFKHADKDPDGCHWFPVPVTRVYIAEATSVLAQLGAHVSVEMEIYQVWFIQKYGAAMPHISSSAVFQHYYVPGTDLNDLSFFRALINAVRDSRG